MFQSVNTFTDNTFFYLLDNLLFTLGYSTVEFHCFIVLDVFLYIPRLVLVFQDVSVIYEH